MNERDAQARALMRAFFPVRRMMIEQLQKRKLDVCAGVALNRIAEAGGSMRVCELAGSLSVAPPTVTQLIARLEREGLLERRQDEADGRARRVCLTELGRTHTADMNARAVALFSGLCRALGAEQSAQLTDLLLQVQNYFETHQKEEQTCERS